MAGSYERRVNCSWEAIAIPKYVSHYFSCRIIPNPGLDMGRDGIIDNRHMILAYDTSDFAVTVSPPGYSGKFQNGTYYLPPGIHTPGVQYICTPGLYSCISSLAQICGLKRV